MPESALAVAGPALLAAIRGVRRARDKLEGGAPADEDIHDFRVSLRRLRTLLAASRPLLRRKPVGRVVRVLATAARATGPLRDEEVLAETLAELSLRPASRARLDVWLASRGEAAGARRAEGLVEVVDGQLLQALDALTALVARGRRRVRDLEAFADGALLRARHDVAVLAPLATADAVEPLHRLRLAMKRLRYLAEWLAEVFAADGRSRPDRAAALRELTRLAASYQRELGVVHDLDVAQATLAASTFDGRVRGAVMRALAARRRAVVRPALAKLRAELGVLVMAPVDG
ncbi:MAG: CHAD domain-containing protein [Deltaproteobacteria bacterium]|nr:CHAD domain-containing protein [Deltaproteobacteria bacterium]